MNEKELKDFIENLTNENLKKIHTRKDTEYFYPHQNVLILELRRPLKFSFLCDYGLFRCIGDSIGIFAGTETMEIAINDFLTRTIKIPSIKTIKWEEVKYHEYKAECEKFSVLNIQY